MRLAYALAALAVVAILLSTFALAQLYKVLRHELTCTYITYINASCSGGKCWFDIPAEPETWYKIIEIKCSGEGVLALYLKTDEWTTAKIVGEDVEIFLKKGDTAVLPVVAGEEPVKYEIYVMTTAPLGRTAGTLLIAEIS